MDHFYETIDGWFNFQEIYDNALHEAGGTEIITGISGVAPQARSSIRFLTTGIRKQLQTAKEY